MSREEPTASTFDQLLDRSMRGEAIDVERVLADHPELSPEERAQLRELCGQTEGTEPAVSEASPIASSDALPFSHIGPHRLLARIGAGSMGVVFLAYDDLLGRQVAIKVLGPDILGTGERAERFDREVRAAARLGHPHIVTVHASGKQDGLRYMVMEFVPGTSLNQIAATATAKGSRVPLADVLRHGSEIARALHVAHQAGIVHRDVKPSNIRIHEDGRAILLDFGLARDLGDATITEAGAFRGSPQYASPEQVDPGRVEIDARTDVYSLGATLYELLTGVAPFRGDTREQLFHAILTRDPVPPRRLNPAVSRDLETVVLATLDKDPARRHPSAAALAADIEAVRDGRPVSVRPPTTAGRIWRWALRHPARAGLAAALILGLPTIAGLGGFVAAKFPTIKRAEATERARSIADLVEIAYLEFGEESPASARAHFERALAEDPGNAEACAGFAMVRILQKEPALALAFLDGLGEPMRGSTWFGMLRAEAQKQLESDGGDTAPAASVPPASTATDHFVRGFFRLQMVHGGNTSLAIPAFEDLRAAVWQSPVANALYLSELGHAAMHAGRNDEAKDIATAIERLRPESPTRWFAVGRMLRRADKAAALRALEKAADPPPRSPAARDFIAISLAEIEPNPERLRLAEALSAGNRRDFPERLGGFHSSGIVALARRETEAAQAHLRHAAELDPDHVETRQRLFTLALSQNDFDTAIAEAREIVRIVPKRKAAWTRLGLLLVERGDLDESIACFERALAIGPADAPEALCNLGTALLRGGRFLEALEKLKLGHEIGSRQADWRHPSAEWVADAERVISYEKRLEEHKNGNRPESSAADLIRFARHVSRAKRLYVEEARLLEHVFAHEPGTLSQVRPDLVLEAAGAFVNAGLGKGRDAPADAALRAELRSDALALMKWKLAELEEAMLDGPGRGTAEARVRNWMKDARLSVVGPRLVSPELPPEEAAGWRAFWARCAAIAPEPRPESAPAISR